MKLALCFLQVGLNPTRALKVLKQDRATEVVALRQKALLRKKEELASVERSMKASSEAALELLPRYESLVRELG